jgi:hypothetical protein
VPVGGIDPPEPVLFGNAAHHTGEPAERVGQGPIEVEDGKAIFCAHVRYNDRAPVMNHGQPYIRDLSRERVISQCRWEAFRGSGPGGQKRNKTSSAVRVIHLPTGIAATASESRSQADNRAKALGRLRHRIALEIRQGVDVDLFETPAWLVEIAPPARGEGIRLARVPRRHECYLDVIALLLDLLSAVGGSVSVAAANVGTSSSDLVAFLQRDEKLLARVNQIRRDFGLKLLGGS